MTEPGQPAPFGPPDLPDYDYRSPNFTYGNWRAFQPYVCRICNQEDITRPPAGLIEWMEEDGELCGDFVPVCYDHMHLAEARWWKHFGGTA